MTKLHTKGPWMLSGRTIMEDFGPLGSGRAIATVIGGRGSGPYFVEDPDEKRANANLIVAAPELLEFVKDWLSSQVSDDNYMTAKARALITKATGEPQ